MLAFSLLTFSIKGRIIYSNQEPPSYLFLILTCLFEVRVTEGKRVNVKDRVRDRIFYPLVHAPDDLNIQDVARLKPGVSSESPMWVAGVPDTWPIFYKFSHPIGMVLGLKVEQLGHEWCIYGMLTLQEWLFLVFHNSDPNPISINTN